MRRWVVPFLLAAVGLAVGAAATALADGRVRFVLDRLSALAAPPPADRPPPDRPPGPAGAEGPEGRAGDHLAHAYEHLTLPALALRGEDGADAKELSVLLDAAREFYRAAHKAYKDGDHERADEMAHAADDAANGILLTLQANAGKLVNVPAPPVVVHGPPAPPRRGDPPPPPPGARDAAPPGREAPPAPRGEKDAPPPPGRDAPPPPRGGNDISYPVGDFSLTDQDGREVRAADLRGKVWVASFTFTRCSGPCPLVSATMERLQTDFADQPDVRLVSFTVDPKYDIPEVLKRYAGRYHANSDRWLFLTGQEADVYRLLHEGFKVGAARNTDADATAGNAVVHSTRLAVVDRKGRVRGYFSGAANEDSENREKGYEDNLANLRREVARLLAANRDPKDAAEEMIKHVGDRLKNTPEDDAKGPGRAFVAAAEKSLDAARKALTAGDYIKTVDLARAADAWSHVAEHLKRADHPDANRPRPPDGREPPPRPPEDR